MDKIHELIKRIIIDPKIMAGKPVVKGTRLTVEHILGLLAEGMSPNEILQEYIRLKQKDILACIAFAKEALQNSTFMPLHN